MSKQEKEGMSTMLYQIQNVNKQKEIIKRIKWKLQGWKIQFQTLKNSLDEFSSRLELAHTKRISDLEDKNYASQRTERKE